MVLDCIDLRSLPSSFLKPLAQFIHRYIDTCYVLILNIENKARESITSFGVCDNLCLCIQFEPDQDRQNVGPDLDPTRLTIG